MTNELTTSDPPNIQPELKWFDKAVAILSVAGALFTAAAFTLEMSPAVSPVPFGPYSMAIGGATGFVMSTFAVVGGLAAVISKKEVQNGQRIRATLAFWIVVAGVVMLAAIPVTLLGLWMGFILTAFPNGEASNF